MLGRRRSIISLAVAVALLGAHASTALHLLLIEHEICPEHGEIVEGSSRQPSPSPLRPSSTPHLALESTAQPAPHAHDQCLVRLEQPDGTWPAGAHSVGVQPDWALRLNPLADGDGAPEDLRLYRLAPKNSPPV
ncbi:MAG TPA: hypothetical protein VH374_01530 [Polyangia bacterium]|jgi:hypothetical protein|nr:hypothetical protein [Polyangia bacterium]